MQYSLPILRVNVTFPSTRQIFYHDLLSTNELNGFSYDRPWVMSMVLELSMHLNQSMDA
jgi:predicted amidohydrolase